jgi:hypothetical protein
MSGPALPPSSSLSRLAVAALACVLLAACDAATSANPPPHPVVSEAHAPPEQAGPQPASFSPPPQTFEPPLAVEPGFNQAQYSERLAITGVRLGELPITFGRTMISDVLARIGAGERGDRGDAGEFEAWICYTAPHHYRLWLVSNIAGGGEFITGARAIMDAAAAPDEKCPTLPGRYGPVRFDPDVASLGDTTAQIEHRLGAAPAFGDWHVYTHEVAYRRDSLDKTDMNKVALRIIDGRVVGLEISKSTIDR